MTDAPPAERGERIAKWLARAGVASRRDAEKLLAEGVVRLDGAVVTHPATFVMPDSIVQVRGAAVDAPDRTRLWRYHKPEGLMTTHKDPQGRPTVFDTLPPDMPRVVSVGRLDLNSEGLLLLTNDGALARRLELPSNGWIRRYRVRVYGPVDPKALGLLAKGVTVDGEKYGQIEAALEARTGTNSWLSVALKEGRNREVRKVMGHLGLQVTRLIRVAYGPFQLGNLERRAVDEITGKVLREQLSGLPAPERHEGGPSLPPLPSGEGRGEGPALAAARNNARRWNVAGNSALALTPTLSQRGKGRRRIRIIAGTWRGRALSAPAGAGTRPTADRVRQALFDRLAHAPWAGQALLEGAAVLDAFAGTGALGLEALSRGAAHATFMERDRPALAVLRANVSACRADAQCTVLAADVLRPPPGRPCGLAFLDPPYAQALVPRAVAALQGAGWLAPGAVLVTETGADEAPPDLPGALARFAHGAAAVHVFKLP